VNVDCRQISAYLEPYGDGELETAQVALVEGHLAACVTCQESVAELRRFQELLRRQPRETASDTLRARVVRASRRSAVRRVARVSILAPVAATVLLALGAVIGVRALGPAIPAAPSPLVVGLVGQHMVYSQLESPAEFPSADGREVHEWFRDRLSMSVTVPDYSPAGIRLLGGRITDGGGRRAAYLLYAKGHTLMSAFAVAGEEFPLTGTKAVSYRGSTYRSVEATGHRGVFWVQDGTVLGLISTLDLGGLLECADRLRAQREQELRS
jgi:anti-sigma factor RsiW